MALARTADPDLRDQGPKARFTATSLGLVWTLLVPLATVVIYSTVFSTIFRAQAPPMGNGHDGVFAVWFFVGLVDMERLLAGVRGRD